MFVDINIDVERSMYDCFILGSVVLVFIGEEIFSGLLCGRSFRCGFFVIIGVWEVLVGLEFEELYLFLLLLIVGGDCELFEIKGFLFLFWFLL